MSFSNIISVSPPVYDQIIGMVSTENLHIFGITVSLAWQLPDEIHYPHHDDKPEAAAEMGNRRNGSFKPNPLEDYSLYYDRKHYHDHRIKVEHKNPSDEHRKSAWTHASWAKESNAYAPSVHMIYPAYRMRRSIVSKSRESPNVMHSEVKHFLNHHRSSRISLYKSIEKYLNA